MKINTRRLVILLLLLAVTARAAEPDWPCFRGPEYNSISLETDWAPLKSTNDLEITWEKNIGDGFSCVTI